MQLDLKLICQIPKLLKNKEFVSFFSDGRLFSATVSDFAARDPLIVDAGHLIRTEEHDSKWLNGNLFFYLFHLMFSLSLTFCPVLNEYVIGIPSFHGDWSIKLFICNLKIHVSIEFVLSKLEQCILSIIYQNSHPVLREMNSIIHGCLKFLKATSKI